MQIWARKKMPHFFRREIKFLLGFSALLLVPVLAFSTTDTTPPSTPQNLSTAAVSLTSIRVAWGPSTDNIAVAGYNLYQDGRLVVRTPNPSYDVIGLVAPTKHNYTISAYDAAGNTSAPSAPVLGTISLPDILPPTAPVNVLASASGTTSMKVSWTPSTDNVGVLGYNLYQDGKYVVKTANPYYIVTGLVAPTKHTYTISAYDAAGNVSAPSAGALGTINAVIYNTTVAQNYDQAVLVDHPVGFWDVKASGGTETDLSGYGSAGTYKNGIPSTVTMPNGDAAADFNGTNQYLTIPSKTSFSVKNTGNLTWEAWVRPDTLYFPIVSSDGYVDFMGKCQSYSPTCEWESRMYGANTSQGRSARLSAYIFNPSAGLGSAADWQPSSGVIGAGQWIHVVGEYTLQSQPSGCSSAYPGSINIWVNGVKWDQAAHSPTGCMSQYSVSPQTENSPINIATMAMDTWFKGAIGKVAIYNYLLSPARITAHYTAMTGKVVAGSCGATCNL